MRKLSALLALTMFALAAIGQSKYVRCASDQYLKEEIKKNPDRGKSLEALNKKVDELVAASAASGSTARTGTVYIPVVINVVYNTPEENISDRQIQSQMDVLNADFSAANAEIKRSRSYDFAGYLGAVANFNIQFCLSAVVRTHTNVTSWSTNNAVKRTANGGQDPLNASTMLNIWVCNLGSNLLGYAQFPNGSTETDGVVILYSAFGTRNAGATADPYDEGRTATHEIGHWFGLYHTFQGGCNKQNDQVDDTPPTAAPTFGCPGAGYMSTCKPSQLVQYMNYMDYTEDLCMYMFTKGQLARVDGFLMAGRADYILSACPATTVSRNANMNISQSTSSADEVSVYPTIVHSQATVSIPSVITGKADISLLDQSGTPVQRKNVALHAGKNQVVLDVSTLPAGMYLIKVNKPGGTIETKKLVKQ